MPRAILVIVSFLLGAAPAAAQHMHPAQANAAVPAQSAPAAPSAGWATDAPLRAGMGRIGRSVATLAESRPEPARVPVLADSIATDVAYLVTRCKLDPAADAALHVIIAKLMQGAAVLKRQPADAAAIALLRGAVNDYARSFDDPAFRAQLAKRTPAAH